MVSSVFKVISQSEVQNNLQFLFESKFVLFVK